MSQAGKSMFSINQPDKASKGFTSNGKRSANATTVYQVKTMDNSHKMENKLTQLSDLKTHIEELTEDTLQSKPVELTPNIQPTPVS